MRFLRKGEYSAQRRKPLDKAFFPQRNRERNRYETSVERIAGVDMASIQHRGEEVMSPRGATLRGWARLLAEYVAKAQLQVEADPPPERHAVIVGWGNLKELSTVELGQLRAEWKAKIAYLVEFSQLYLIEDA